MDDLERAWVRNKAEEHYGRTRSSQVTSAWRGVIAAVIGSIVSVKHWFIH